MAVDEVFAGAAKDDLARDGDLAIFLEADGRFLFVAIVEDDGDAGFSDACLAAFVDQILILMLDQSTARLL